MTKISQSKLFEYLASHPGDIDLDDLGNFANQNKHIDNTLSNLDITNINNEKKEILDKEQLDTFDKTYKDKHKVSVKTSESFSEEKEGGFSNRKVTLESVGCVEIKSQPTTEPITENYITKEVSDETPKYKYNFNIPKIIAPNSEEIARISDLDRKVVSKKSIKRDSLIGNKDSSISKYGNHKMVNCKYVKLMKEDSDFSNHRRVREICRLLEGNSKIEAFNNFFKFNYAVRFLDGDISTDDVIIEVRKFNKFVKSNLENRIIMCKEDYNKSVKLKNKIESMGHKYLYHSADEMSFERKLMRLELLQENKLTIPKNKNLISKVGNISDEEYLEDYLERFKEFVENIWKETGLSREVSNEIKLFYIVVRGRYEQLVTYHRKILKNAHRYRTENNLSFDDIRNMNEMYRGAAIFWIISKYKFEDIMDSSEYKTIKDALVIPTYFYENKYDFTNELFIKATLPFDKVANIVLSNYKLYT